MRGSTLVEVLVATMILALASVAMASVFLTAAAGDGRLEARQQAALQMNRVLEGLKSYATADHSALTRAFAPFGCWDFIDPATGSCPPGRWALDPGSHDVTRLLAPRLSEPPLGMTLEYTVEPFADGRSRITGTVRWESPS